MIGTSWAVQKRETAVIIRTALNKRPSAFGDWHVGEKGAL